MGWGGGRGGGRGTGTVEVGVGWLADVFFAVFGGDEADEAVPGLVVGSVGGHVMGAMSGYTVGIILDVELMPKPALGFAKAFCSWPCLPRYMCRYCVVN